MVHRNSKLLLVILLSSLMVVSSGCAKSHATPHPNAINDFDSGTADSLDIYQSSLNQAKANIADGTWPSSWAKDVNKAGFLYNNLRADYLLYRDVEKGVKAGDAVALQALVKQDLDNVARTLAELFRRTK